MSKRPTLSAHRRYLVLERDGFTCRYCGAKAPEATLEVDHVLAVARGGTNDMNNLVTACMECNRGKAAKKLIDLRPIADELVLTRRALTESRGAAIRLGREKAAIYRAWEQRGRVIELLMERLGAPQQHPDFLIDLVGMHRANHPEHWTLPADLQARLDGRKNAA